MLDGLRDADFDAYLPAKQRSNVYNRERLDVKQRLLALAPRFASLTGSDGASLEVAASTEHPALSNQRQVEAQHLYLFRGEVARKQLDAIIDRARGVASLLGDPTPQRSHLYLAIGLSVDRVEVTLGLHPEATVDRQNLARKTSDPYELDRLVSLLHQLPDGFLIGGHDVCAIDRDALQALVRSSDTLTIARSRPRAEALSAGAGIADLLTSDLAALLPLYRFCAWARDNDHVSVKEALEKTQTERRQKGITRGDEVRVVRGLFAGQHGTVQEVDPRGGLRLLVGKRTVKLDAADVERRA